MNVLVPGFLPGGPEMMIVVALVIVLFLGPKKIPKVARSFGQATSEWKKGRKETSEEINEELSTDAK